MAKKKKPVKKHVELRLPAHVCPAPEEFVVVPVPVAPEKVEPLPEAHGPIRCIATRGWFGGIALTPVDGSTLPEIAENGTEMDVKFLPTLPPLPHD